MTREAYKRIFQEIIEEEILQLIDDQDEMTRSDLQGCVTAIVRKAMEYKEVAP